MLSSDATFDDDHESSNFLQGSAHDENHPLILQPLTVQAYQGQFKNLETLDAGVANDICSPLTNMTSIQRYLALNFYLERPREELALRDAYNQHKNDSPHPLFLIVTGPSGVGKTTLVKQTLRSLVLDHDDSIFITGKFDFLCRPAPYTAFVSAFTEFTEMIVTRGEDVVKDMRKKILDALGDDVDIARVLIGMIPSLERILEMKNNKSSTITPVGDAMQRFIFIFQNFMRAICSTRQPVVLFLDDLQFADECSLALLKSIVTDVNEGLVVVGVHQSETAETSSSNLFLSKLRLLENKGSVHVAQVDVSNLTKESVVEMISDAMQINSSCLECLVQIACQQTNLSFFQVKMQMMRLIETDMLSFDEATGYWCWNEEDSRSTRDHAQIVEGYPEVFLRRQLSEDVQNMLKVAACLGYNFNEELLQYVLDTPVRHLITAAMSGAIVENESRNGYTFQHDELQKASYCLIPEAERELFHLEVGRRMWRKFNPDELECYMFDFLSQMYMGRRLITRKKECVAVATLCLHAGLRAAKSSAFRTSFEYLEMGIGLLDDGIWHENYELALSLYNASSGLALCTTNIARLYTSLDVIMLNAKAYIDKIQAFALKIYVLGLEGRQLEAIDVGIEVLSQLGMKIPSRFYVFHLFVSLQCVKKLLQGKSDDQLLRMPNITNENALACLKILHILSFNTLTVKPMLTGFIFLKSMILTLKYGLSAFASVAFASYGMICLSLFKDIDSAFRYGKLGVTLLDRFQAKEYLPRVYFAFYGCLYVWKKPSNDVLVPLLLGYRTGMQVRDVEAGCLCANYYFVHAFTAGTNLAVMHKELGEVRETMTSIGLSSMLLFTLPSLQMIEDFMGISNDPFAVRGSILDFDEAIRDGTASGNVILVLVLHSLRMTTAYVFNNYELAAKELSRIPNHTWKRMFTTNKVSFLNTSALICLSRAREGYSRRKNIQVAIVCLNELKMWRRRTTAEIFLIEAELASVRGQKAKAFEKYVCAIALATYHGYTYMVALANERAARHCWAHSDYEETSSFFDAALDSYKQWGAMGKYKQLFSEVQSLNLSR